MSRSTHESIVLKASGFAPGAQGSGNGTGIDTKGYRLATLPINCTTGSGKTLDVKVQSSTDNGSTDAYADISGAAITQITANNKTAMIVVRACEKERYLRAVVAGGTSPVASIGPWELSDPINLPVSSAADEVVVV